MDKIIVGDIVRLIGLPDWLLEDLPADEQNEIRSFVGKTASVTKIDENGYFWLGFGIVENNTEHSIYRGHSFGVPKEFLKLEDTSE